MSISKSNSVHVGRMERKQSLHLESIFKCHGVRITPRGISIINNKCFLKPFHLLRSLSTTPPSVFQYSIEMPMYFRKSRRLSAKVVGKDVQLNMFRRAFVCATDN